MSVSTLQYRLSGDVPKQLTGRFSELNSTELNDFEGFVLSDFSGIRFFGFVPNEFSDESQEQVFVPPIELTRAEYDKIARTYIGKMKAGELDKIILSRAIAFPSPFQLDQLFDSLCQAYPNAFVYLISDESLGTWIGATPERLITFRNNKGDVMSLAGTKLSNDDSPWRKKELFEQQYVTEYIASILSRSNFKEVVLEGPHERKAGPVKHLCTEIKFDGDRPSWQLVRELHPTPAVCGLPKEDAYQLILKKEPHERGLYAGILGFVTKESFELFVNLRCARQYGDALYLFVGGGLTADSDPEEEWKETTNKAKTIADFL